MSSIAAIAETLKSVAVAGMKPKELIAAVRTKHPEASKKEIVRAAFYALTLDQGADAKQVEDLHSFAIGERGTDEETSVPSHKLKRRPRKPSGTTEVAH